MRKNDKFLLARRKEGGSQGGKWEFPGGKVDPGETPKAGLERELFEEFEIRVQVGDFIAAHRFHNDNTDYELLAYWVEHLGGDFVLHEHSEIRWVFKDDIPAFDLSPSDRAIVPFLP